jgi:predicted HicB family RNase H-like nuclease
MKNFLEYKGFIGSVNFSNEDEVFYGKIEGIDDLVTFEGESVSELKDAFKMMVDSHIEDCKADGVPVEKSYKGSFNVRLNPELHKKASRKAIKCGMSLNQFVQKAIDHEVNSSDECCCS